MSELLSKCVHCGLPRSRHLTAMKYCDTNQTHMFSPKTPVSEPAIKGYPAISSIPSNAGSMAGDTRCENCRQSVHNHIDSMCFPAKAAPSTMFAEYIEAKYPSIKSDPNDSEAEKWMRSNFRKAHEETWNAARQSLVVEEFCSFTANGKHQASAMGDCIYCSAKDRPHAMSKAAPESEHEAFEKALCEFRKSYAPLAPSARVLESFTQGWSARARLDAERGR